MAIEQQGTHGVIGDDLVVLRALWEMRNVAVTRDQILAKLTNSGLEREFTPTGLDEILASLSTELAIVHSDGKYEIAGNGTARLGPLVERSLGSLDGPRA